MKSPPDNNLPRPNCDNDGKAEIKNETKNGGLAYSSPVWIPRISNFRQFPSASENVSCQWSSVDHPERTSCYTSFTRPRTTLWRPGGRLSVTYRKIPKIRPGAYIFQRLFLRGLLLEGLIFGLALFLEGNLPFFFVLLFIWGQFPSKSHPPPPPKGLIFGGAI